MITTTATSQTEILRRIQTLYLQGAPFDADVTYGGGGFWREGLARPRYCYDLEPRFPFVEQADVRQLRVPLELQPNGFQSVAFDPPFIHAPGKASIIGQRFGGYPSQRALREMYQEALDGLWEIIVPNGILVFKCQDIVESGKQNWNHCHVWEIALAAGFRAEDLFILTGRTPIVGHNHHRQQHARKDHAYFWVFRR
jgi:hypothetical protein